MRVFLIATAFLLVQCKQKDWHRNEQPAAVKCDCDKKIKEDSAYISNLHSSFDDMALAANERERVIDSLKDALFIANYKVERVRYYWNIVNRNPSQVKFLKGWIKRAIE